MADSLRACGAEVWHDGDADVRDRRVRQRVAQAISNARYILLCVEDTFRNSRWVQAEYRPALALEENGKLTRIVLALRGHEAPDLLRHCPRFDWDKSHFLAEFLRNGNRLPDLVSKPNTITYRVQNYRELAAGSGNVQLQNEAESFEPLNILLPILRRELDEVANNAGSEEYYYWLMAAAGLVERGWDKLPSSDTLDGALVRELGRRASRSADADNRANGIRVLLTCDRAWRTTSSLSDVLDVLREEANASNIGLAGEWFAANARRFEPEDHAVTYLAALRCPRLFRDGPAESLTSGLPEAVRCRVYMEDPLDNLLRNEHMWLIEERLTFLLALRGRFFRWHDPDELGQPEELWRSFVDGDDKWCSQGRFAGQDVNCGHFFALSPLGADAEAEFYEINTKKGVFFSAQLSVHKVLYLTSYAGIKIAFDAVVEDPSDFNVPFIAEELVEIKKGGSILTDRIGDWAIRRNCSPPSRAERDNVCHAN